DPVQQGGLGAGQQHQGARFGHRPAGVAADGAAQGPPPAQVPAEAVPADPAAAGELSAPGLGGGGVDEQQVEFGAGQAAVQREQQAHRAAGAGLVDDDRPAAAQRGQDAQVVQQVGDPAPERVGNSPQA